VRGFWNPEKKTFYSRQGNAFDLPQDIIDSMPTDLFLDGELWYGADLTSQVLNTPPSPPSRLGLEETISKKR